MARRARHPRPDHAGELVIGLVNTMPPAAMRATEARFHTLLAAAPPGVTIRARVFADRASHPCPSEGHEDLDALWDASLDGLIVTGAEPRALAITDEPLWPRLADIVDRAAENTLSTLWSCMAAHVAVFRLDGIHRRRLPEKLWGVFDCEKVSDHTLLSGAPMRWPVPHSRCNDLDEGELHAAGYQILSRSGRVGADLFVKQTRESLFVMAQGHLEYAPDSLLREYQREVKRFLAGQRPGYPDPPEGYCAPDAVACLTATRDRIGRDPACASVALTEQAAAFTPARDWSAHATCLHAAWLSCVVERKAARSLAQRPPFRRPSPRARGRLTGNILMGNIAPTGSPSPVNHARMGFVRT